MELEETIKYLGENLRVEVDIETKYHEDEPTTIIVSLFIGDSIISSDSGSIPS